MHTEGAMEIAHVVRNMPSLKVLDLNGEFLFDCILVLMRFCF
jgi:hypothetical protein